MVGALADAATDWPVGATAVKESYRGEELALIAAMERGEDGWFFAEWSATGSVKFGGRPDVCLDCHGSGGDAVRSIPLR